MKHVFEGYLDIQAGLGILKRSNPEPYPPHVKSWMPGMPPMEEPQEALLNPTEAV